MSDMKVTPKVKELIEWEHIDVVNRMLDDGSSPSSICKWINDQGFKISHPVIYQYAKLRKDAIANKVNMQNLITPVSTVKRTPVVSQESVNLAKNEVDVLDKLIQRGFQSLDKLFDNPEFNVSVYTLIDAMRMKNRLLNGSHQGYTNYGLECLQQLEAGKFAVIRDVLFTFIPEDKLEQAIQAMEEAEDNYYKGTEYYEEYLSAKHIEERVS